MDHRITTRIPAVTYKKLADRARSERKAEAVIVREALEAHLAGSESAFDELTRIGGLGIVQGPGDLSTNKAHMEGFGQHVSTRSPRHRAPRRAHRRRDSLHDKCTTQLRSIVLPFITTWPVLTEAAWLLRTYPEGIQQMFVWVNARKLQITAIGDEAAPWIAAFFRKYGNIEPQLADASLVYVAERDNLDAVFTLDHDDRVYRFGRNRRLRLLPD